MAVTPLGLDGLRAAVIGGTGVLGGRFAACLADAGAHVYVMGRSAQRGRAAVEGILRNGGSAEFVSVDALDRTSLEDAAGAVLASGGLDVLVNAAGVNSTTPFTGSSLCVVDPPGSGAGGG